MTFKGFSTKIYKYLWYFCFSDEKLLEIYQIRWDLARSRRYLAQISTDPAKYRQWRWNPKPDGPKPDDPTIITGRFWFCFSPTWIFRVGSDSGTNPTRPNLWTPLSFNLPTIPYHSHYPKKKKKSVYSPINVAIDQFGL